MQIVIPFKTPTVNHLYTRNRFGNQCKTAKANKLKKEIGDIEMPKYSREELVGKKLKVRIKIYENWYCKNGSVKKKDVANREKFLIDSVFEALGFDDKMIFEHNIFKIQSETEEKAVIDIEVYHENFN